MARVLLAALVLGALLDSKGVQADDFAALFKDPPASCRILKINHGWPEDESGRNARVAALQRGGFGGLVSSLSFGNGYVNNPTNWDAMRGGGEALRKAGLEQWLYDEAGYPSGRAGGLVLKDHPEREARGLFATIAKSAFAPDGLRNIAPLAAVTASSTDQNGGIYQPANAVNGVLDPEDWRHWSNDAAADPASADKPTWLLLNWDAPKAVKKVVLTTMKGYEVQAYRIEFWDGSAWRTFADADVAGNVAVTRTHESGQTVTTDRLRFLGKSGPARQSSITRVVELEAFEPVGDACETISLAVPPGRLLFARAFRMNEANGIQLKGAVDLPAPAGGMFSWTAPHGQWQLLAVSEGRLFEGSQVDFSGVPEHAPYVSLLDPEAVSAFIEITHERLAKEFGNNLGQMFVSTFTDEPSLIADYYARAMPWSPVAWHPSLEEGFANQTGRKLFDELPLLFLDGEGAARTRHDFWKTTAGQLRQNYFLRIRNWCRAHQIPSGGHLLLEEDIRHHVPLYGDFFACMREMDVQGIDVLSCDPAQSPWFAARMASSAGELEGNTLVMSETSDFIEQLAKPKKHVSMAQFRGTINRLLLGGVNRFNSYSFYPRDDWSDAELRALNDWTGRNCFALTGGRRNARVAVLYPAETAWTRFKPSKHGFVDAGPLADRLARIFDQVNDLLYVNRHEFSHIDTRTLIAAKAGNAELHFNNLAFSAVVLPDTDTMPEAAWRNVERFWERGGVVIAVGALPLNSEKGFPSKTAIAIGQRIFGAAAEPRGIWSAIRQGFVEKQEADGRGWVANSKGGVGIYLTPDEVRKLPAILAQVTPPDVTVDGASSPVRMTRRVIDGKDVYFVINDSAAPWQGTVHFGQARAGELLDPATGVIMPLADPANVKFTLDAWGAVLVRLEGVPRERLHPDTVNASDGVKKHMF